MTSWYWQSSGTSEDFQLFRDEPDHIRNQHKSKKLLLVLVVGRYRSIGMLGKEMGYKTSTCQMQYDANNKETDQKDPCFIYSGGNGPRKCRKH